MDDTISFLVPTAGRKELNNCLVSIVDQLTDGDEIIVIGDILDGTLHETESIVSNYSHVKYIEHSGTKHTYGHQQLNQGIAIAQASYLCFNDDDDIWVPGAIDKIRLQINLNPGIPLLFRHLTYFGYVSPITPGLFQEGNFSGHNLVCPNVAGKLGTWTDHYEGDWDFVSSTVAFYDELIWCDDVISIGRPDISIINELYRIYGRPWTR